MTTLAQELGFTAAQARAIAEKGFEFAAAGDFEGALDIFNGLLVLNPEDGSMHAARGAVLQEQGQIAEAEADYDKAIALDPKAVLARCNRGELRLRRGDTAGVEDLEVAASIESPIKARASALLKTIRR